MPECNFNKVDLQFYKIELWHGCSPVNMLLIFRASFCKNTYEQLLLKFCEIWWKNVKIDFISESGVILEIIYSLNAIL